MTWLEWNTSARSWTVALGEASPRRTDEGLEKLFEGSLRRNRNVGVCHKLRYTCHETSTEGTVNFVDVTAPPAHALHYCGMDPRVNQSCSPT